MVSDCFGLFHFMTVKSIVRLHAQGDPGSKEVGKTTSDGMATGLAMINDFLPRRRWPFRSSHLAIASLNDTGGCAIKDLFSQPLWPLCRYRKESQPK